MVRSHVCRGRPQGRLQYLGGLLIQADLARVWSCIGSERATCPNSLRRLALMVWVTGGWADRRRTSRLVTCAAKYSSLYSSWALTWRTRSRNWSGKPIPGNDFTCTHWPTSPCMVVDPMTPNKTRHHASHYNDYLGIVRNYHADSRVTWHGSSRLALYILTWDYASKRLGKWSLFVRPPPISVPNAIQISKFLRPLCIVLYAAVWLQTDN